MIECPRCGFTQPKDQFCASCGLDIDAYVAKPKPILVRLVQNPNLHLTLIGILVVLVIGYIFYSQRELVSRQMGNLLDLPVSSRDAGDAEDPLNAARPAARAAARPQAAVSPPTEGGGPTANTAATGALAGQAADGSGEGTADGSAAKGGAADPSAVRLSASNKLEVTHWEVPREAMANLIALAEKLGESNAGRAYLYPSGSKIADQIQSVGQRLALGRNVAVKAGGQMTMETPPTTTEAFQYGLFIQLTKVDGKDLGLKWESQLVLPQPETAAEAAAGAPAVRSTVETALNGTATLTSAGLLVIVMEPTNRSPREEFLARAGEGPWSVFASPEFRGGLTEWVITVQIK